MTNDIEYLKNKMRLHDIALKGYIQGSVPKQVYDSIANELEELLK